MHLPTLEQVQQLPEYFQRIVEHQHLDALGHMNVQYFLNSFEQGGWGIMERMGVGMQHLEQDHKSIMALRHVITYLAEVYSGESLAVHGRLVAYDHKRFHAIMYMLNHTRPRLAATLEILGIYADLNERKSLPFSPDIVQNLESMLAEQQALDWQPELSGGIKLAAPEAK